MATTKYLWNKQNDSVAMEKDGSGTTTAVYQNDPVPYGRLRSIRRDSKTYTYRYDAQGNTTALTDDTGKTTDTYAYTAFGEEVAKTGTTTNPYRFGGQHGYQYNASTDDYYIRARTYEPEQSRWMSKDPIGFEDGMNLYLYADNEPILMVDPSGELVIASFGSRYVTDMYRRGRIINRKVPCNTLAYQRWDFRLGPKSRTRSGLSGKRTFDGYLVQKVTVHCYMTKSCTRPQVYQDSFSYWETWHVRESDKRINYLYYDGKTKMYKPLEYSDQASWVSPKYGKGVYTQFGEVRYCKGDEVRGEISKWHTPTSPMDQRKYGKANACQTSPGGLPSTGSEPDFWKNRSKHLEGPAGRVFSGSFCCCGNNRGGIARAFPHGADSRRMNRATDNMSGALFNLGLYFTHPYGSIWGSDLSISGYYNSKPDWFTGIFMPMTFTLGGELIPDYWFPDENWR